jgi:hypothetical protein
LTAEETREIARLCSGMLALDPGQSSSCSRPQTKTEPAKEKEKNLESMSITNQFPLS